MEYIVNEDGEITDVFTLEACVEILSAYGYTIEKRND